MPTQVGMTRLARPWVNPFAGWCKTTLAALGNDGWVLV
jgi:hypothetical protein